MAPLRKTRGSGRMALAARQGQAAARPLAARWRSAASTASCCTPWWRQVGGMVVAGCLGSLMRQSALYAPCSAAPAALQMSKVLGAPHTTLTTPSHRASAGPGGISTNEIDASLRLNMKRNEPRMRELEQRFGVTRQSINQVGCVCGLGWVGLGWQ